MPAGFTVSASFPVATAAPAPPIAVARGRSTHTGHGAPESLTLFWARAAVATASKATKTTRMRAEFMTPRRGSREKRVRIGRVRRTDRLFSLHLLAQVPRCGLAGPMLGFAALGRRG